AILQEVVEGWVAASLRNVDGVLARTPWRDSCDGRLVAATRTIAGVNYSLSLPVDERQPPRLEVSLMAEREGSRYMTSLPELGGLSRTRLRRLRYRFTTDGWASSAEVRARLVEREREQPI